jgi:hypothetical protein
MIPPHQIRKVTQVKISNVLSSHATKFFFLGNKITRSKMVFVGISNIILKKVHHLRINGLNSPLRKFKKREEVHGNAGNAYLQKNKPSSKRESLPLHPPTLLIILSKISCKSFFISLERFKSTPRYVNGKSEIFQPKICAKSLASSSSILIVSKSFYNS